MEERIRLVAGVKKNPRGVGVLVARRKKILVSLRVEAGMFQGFWQFPGGKVGEHEDPLVAAERELREECGLEVELDRFEVLGSDDRVYPEVYRGYTFLVRLLDGEEPKWMEKEKNTEWKWVGLDEFRTLRMIPGSETYGEVWLVLKEAWGDREIDVDLEAAVRDMKKEYQLANVSPV